MENENKQKPFLLFGQLCQLIPFRKELHQGDAKCPADYLQSGECWGVLILLNIFVTVEWERFALTVSYFSLKIVLMIRLPDKERAEPVFRGSVLFRSKRGYAGKNKISQNFVST